MKRGASATSTQSVQEAKKRLQKFIKKLDTVPTAILAEEAPKLYTDIIKEVPYKTGALERSVKVRVARDKRRPGINASASARSSKGFNYAGIQHEEESFTHPKATAKDHFISDPFDRAVARIKEKCAKQLRMED